MNDLFKETQIQCSCFGIVGADRKIHVVGLKEQKDNSHIKGA